MGAIEWLERNVYGFSELPSADRDAIFQFTLLWSLFEAQGLHTRASAQAILTLVRERAAQGLLNSDAFAPNLGYFRQRYFDNGHPTPYFNGLHLRNNDCPELVREVLAGRNNDSADSVAALLITVLRLRNNLFHGVKWAYGIRGQRENLEHANATLISALTQLVRNGV